ncbi:hypothetical protein PHAVU_002G278400 [Phaseolus vulgaris]|uniref:Knottins-like domain-containing protein n=1 Tax=Phaseolus vulgaris TaxID=3885 RepID=V7CRL9_PHAVU|nr:hypothetical protein PHAVU_002G278400g [Phaseolus vulgaris]ESW31910.1 hypothetical protein PHAVU_002G278400g [Phaseolus vulgaris]
MERKTLSFLFLFLLVLASDVAVKKAEAKTCFTKKEGWGRCIADFTCARSCRNVGYIGGKCQGLTRRCFCVLNC